MGHSPKNPHPKLGAKAFIFLAAQAIQGANFFDINRYLTDKYFDIVLGCHSPPPGSLSKWTPKSQFFERSTTQKPRNSVDGCLLSVMRVPSFLQGEKLFPEIKLQREKNVSKFSACFFMLNFARRSAKKSERLVDATILRSEIDLSKLVAA